MNSTVIWGLWKSYSVTKALGTVVIQAFAKSSQCVPIFFWPSSLPVPGIPGHLQAAGDWATAAAWEPFSWGHSRDCGGRVWCHVPPGVPAAAEEQCSLTKLVAESGSCARKWPADPVTTERNHNARGKQSRWQIWWQSQWSSTRNYTVTTGRGGSSSQFSLTPYVLRGGQRQRQHESLP